MINFQVCVLGSGSAGNSILVCADKLKLLIDAGLSASEIEARMQRVSINPADLSGILISHEHADHLRSAAVLAKRYKVPIYLNDATHKATGESLKKVKERNIFETNRKFNIDDLIIEPFSVLHDAVDPVGFCLYFKDRKLGIATDLGRPTTLVRHMLKESHALILESNHDPQMLMSGPYPWWLKQRIRGEFGHLSNEETQTLLRDLLHPDLKNLVLAHISEKNNHTSLVHQAAMEILETRDDLKITVSIAGQHEAGEIFEV